MRKGLILAALLLVACLATSGLYLVVYPRCAMPGTLITVTVRVPREVCASTALVWWGDGEASRRSVTGCMDTFSTDHRYRKMGTFRIAAQLFSGEGMDLGSDWMPVIIGGGS